MNLEAEVERLKGLVAQNWEFHEKMRRERDEAHEAARMWCAQAESVGAKIEAALALIDRLQPLLATWEPSSQRLWHEVREALTGGREK